MKPSDHSNREDRALSLLLIVVSLGLGWILLPFYGAIMWGVIVAILFAPIYCRLLPRLKQRRTAAALLTLLIVLLIVIVPFALITASVAREAAAIYQRVQSGELDPAIYFRGLFNALPAWATSLLERFDMADFEALRRWLSAALTQASRFIATHALNVGQNTFDFVISVFVMLYLAFFLIRDGDGLVRAMKRAIPLTPSHKQELLDKFATVVRATVKGNLVVAAVQGALGGIAFWFLGVSGALLWAVLMAFFSLLPAVGAGLVWLPVALFMLATGELGKGLALIAYGVLVIGLVDNLLRPVLVGRDTQMPDYLVLVSTLGGIALIGINGFVVGPAAAAMFIAVWHIHVKSLAVETTDDEPRFDRRAPED
jgi:predicted PurR-regulated permease PerM